MNPVMVLTKNNLEMNQRCIKAALEQDIPTKVWIYDNESTDGTKDWLDDMHAIGDYRGVNLSTGVDLGVSEGWNYVLDVLFKNWDTEHVLVINSDTILPPWFYSTLLSYPGPFITGVSVGSMEEIATIPPRKELAPCPDFSAFLIRKECWEKVGEFDGKMVLYASDLDYHIRAHRAGVRLMNAGVPFYHERSSTLNYASPQEKQRIRLQADMDREVLRQKWSCNAWDNSYTAMFDEKLFGIDVK